jgi:hypothetical protein
MDNELRKLRIIEQLARVDDSGLLEKIEALLFRDAPVKFASIIPSTLEQAVKLGMDDVAENRVFAHLSLKLAWL